MRLVNTRTLELHEFFDSNIPPYAILSHRWEQDEVSYQDMLGGRKKDGAGYAKIRKSCGVAFGSRDRFEWIWIDTCCIDKKSSAELSEAINAMFKWYQNSARCYAYLSDVNGVRDEIGNFHWPTFQYSKWFTRVWTLQELLAPQDLVFFDFQWQVIGAKSTMYPEIEAATGIPYPALSSYLQTSYSVAQKMSWASRRETSRVEDLAYCLLGLFDVNMPLLYGEGEKAFRRLQEEIIRTSNDDTVLVWSHPLSAGGLLHNQNAYMLGDRLGSTLLAPSPNCFGACGEIGRAVFDWHKPYSLTNQGLKLSRAFYYDSQAKPGERSYLIPLNCGLNRCRKTPDGQESLTCERLAMRVQASFDDPNENPHTMWRERLLTLPSSAAQVEGKRTIYLPFHWLSELH